MGDCSWGVAISRWPLSTFAWRGKPGSSGTIFKTTDETRVDLVHYIRHESSHGVARTGVRNWCISG